MPALSAGFAQISGRSTFTLRWLLVVVTAPVALALPRAASPGQPWRRLKIQAMADISDELIKLERSSEDARRLLTGLDDEEYEAQWKAWRTAAENFQAAVTVYATREDVDHVTA